MNVTGHAVTNELGEEIVTAGGCRKFEGVRTGFQNKSHRRRVLARASSNLRRTGNGASSVTQTAACLCCDGSRWADGDDDYDQKQRWMGRASSSSVAQSEACCCRPPCICQNSSAGGGETRLEQGMAANRQSSQQDGLARVA